MKHALAVLLVVLAACSGEKPAGTGTATATAPEAKPAAPAPPPAQQARDLIANSPDFAEYEFTNAGYTLPTSGAAMNEPHAG